MKNIKLAINILIILILLGVFFCFILKPSDLQLKLNEISKCNSIKEIKNIYIKLEDDKIKSNDKVIKTIKDKIIQLSPSPSEIDSCLKWLPKRPKYLNLVIVPDFSNRITKDSLKNQIKTDKEILIGIWNCFKQNTKEQKASKDRLIIDVTDRDQLAGEFLSFANKSIFDLRKNDTLFKNDFFFKQNDTIFENLINDLYNLASNNKISGANYDEYLEEKLSYYELKSNIYEEYDNKLILITDGYLEYSGHVYTPTASGYSPLTNPIKENNVNHSAWELLICEVRERSTEKDQNTTAILKSYWEPWIKNMQFKYDPNSFFLQHNDASTITIEKIKYFISNSLINKTDLQKPKTPTYISANEIKTQNTKEILYNNKNQATTNSMETANSVEKISYILLNQTDLDEIESKINIITDQNYNQSDRKQLANNLKNKFGKKVKSIEVYLDSQTSTNHFIPFNEYIDNQLALEKYEIEILKPIKNEEFIIKIVERKR